MRVISHSRVDSQGCLSLNRCYLITRIPLLVEEMVQGLDMGIDFNLKYLAKTIEVNNGIVVGVKVGNALNTLENSLIDLLDKGIVAFNLAKIKACVGRIRSAKILTEERNGDDSEKRFVNCGKRQVKVCQWLEKDHDGASANGH